MALAFSHIITRDYGFAPNPFHGFMTLATCKPYIRKKAKVGDFIIGNSSKKYGNKLVYMMKVSEVITFDEYWSSSRFKCKKSIMNGSLVKMYGDNIYHHNENHEWVQEDSHHSYPHGIPNNENIRRDTGFTDHVLVADEFFYFGKSMITLPQQFKRLQYKFRGYKQLDSDDIEELWEYLSSKYPKSELIDDPKQFKSFKRYNGHSAQ